MIRGVAAKLRAACCAELAHGENAGHLHGVGGATEGDRVAGGDDRSCSDGCSISDARYSVCSMADERIFTFGGIGCSGIEAHNRVVAAARVTDARAHS